MKRIAFNLLFIEKRPLTGPGYYAVQLFEHVVLNEGARKHQILAYVQEAAAQHFSEDVRPFIRFTPSFSGRVGRVLWEQAVLPFRCRRDGIDLLFSPGFVSPLWGARHLVATICDMYYRVIPEMLDPFQRAYWALGIPATSRVCDRIITISGHSQADIERYLPAARGKTISIPLASRFRAEATAAAGEASRDTDYVLMVANLTSNKNCEVVVEAVADLNRRRRPVQFVHVGSDLRGLLKDSIERHDAAGFARSVGKVTDDQLRNLYGGCLAVITPSLYEGFGMPAVEAQAMGAPLISSDRAALPEAGGDAALYFDPTDAQALSRQIERVLDYSAADRVDMIDRGLKSSARFSWRRTAAESLSVFDEVLFGASGGAS